MSHIVLELGPPPTAPLSLNRERSLFWAERNRRLHPWRDLAWAMAVTSNLAAVVDGTPCVVTVHIPVPDKRTRDPANYYPVSKACVDGLVRAKVWPDDTPEWVTVAEPVLQLKGDASIHLEARP